MITFPNIEELKELQSIDEPFCVSIYTPLVPADGQPNPNRIELKNLLRHANVALADTDISTRERRKIFRRADELFYDEELWTLRPGSLAIFISADFYRVYHIPDFTTPYMLTIERGFNLEPLQAAVRENRPYVVLALGHKQVRVFEGDHFNLKPVEIKGFPMDMKPTLRIDEYPKWRETHTIAPAATGKGSEASHGQYNVAQVDKTMLEEFFRRIDRRLHRFLLSRHMPLILAGVNYMVPMYRKVNTYQGLFPDCIKGNIQNETLDHIRAKAWQTLSAGAQA